MNNIFKKHHLLGLLLVLVPVFVGAETEEASGYAAAAYARDAERASRYEEIEPAAAELAYAIADKEMIGSVNEIPEGYRVNRNAKKDYIIFEQTGKCDYCSLQYKDLREALKKLKDEGKIVSLKDASLIGANLSGADLTNVDFAGADFREANVEGANFKGTELTNVNFAGVDLSNVDLSGANLSDAFLYNTNFTGADLSGTTFDRASLQYTNFTRANLSGAIFSGVDFTDTDFTNAIGTNVKFFGSLINKKNLPYEILETAEFHEELFKPSRIDRLKRWLKKTVGVEDDTIGVEDDTIYYD
jgi:uncharacterized protein YjbI with pentapeptide repeats